MLDTNAVSAVAKGRAIDLAAMLDHHAFCISVITEAELRFGLARRQINADLRRIVEGFLRTADIRPWTSACAEHYARLRTELETSGKPLAPMDLLIATHALAEGCTLVSADRAFAQVPELRVLDWSVNPPAQQVREKLARAGITERDIEDAVAHARTPVRRATSTKKPAKKPKAK